MSELVEQHRRGRPPSDSPELRERVLSALRRGATYRLAAALALVSENTLLTIRNRNPEFQSECESQRALWAMEQIEELERAAQDPKAWGARKFLASVLRPDLFGEAKRQLEISGPDGSPIQLQSSFGERLKSLSTEELQALARGIAIEGVDYE